MTVEEAWAYYQRHVVVPGIYRARVIFVPTPEIFDVVVEAIATRFDCPRFLGFKGAFKTDGVTCSAIAEHYELMFCLVGVRVTPTDTNYRFDGTPRILEAAAHEISHTCFSILHHAGLDDHVNGEEPFAYLHGFLMSQFSLWCYNVTGNALVLGDKHLSQRVNFYAEQTVGRAIDPFRELNSLQTYYALYHQLHAQQHQTVYVDNTGWQSDTFLS